MSTNKLRKTSEMKFDTITEQLVCISVTTEVQYYVATGRAPTKLGLPWFEHSLIQSSIIMNACIWLFIVSR